MSNNKNLNHVNDKKEATPQAGGVVLTKVDVRKAIRAAPNEVKPNQIGSYHVADVKGLGPVLTVILVPSAGHATQLVLHRPIGVHDLDEKKDWVMSQSSDIDLLPARRNDPEDAKNKALMASNRTRFLVGKGLLEETNGEVYYKGYTTETRSEILRRADEAMQVAKKEKKLATNAKRHDFMSEKLKLVEKALQTALDTTEGRTAVEYGVERTYRTRGGALDDVDQVAVPGLHGKSLVEVYAVLPKLMIEGIGRGGTSVVKEVHTTQVVNKIEHTGDATLELQYEDLIDRVNTDINESISGLSDAMTLLTKISQLGKENPQLSDDLEQLKQAMNSTSKALESAKQHELQDLGLD